MKKALSLFILPLTLALMTGCSKPPDAEMAGAEQAVASAAATQAGKYAPADWQMVQDTLLAARSEIASQDERFSLFRSYGKSKALFEKTTTLAATAMTNAEAGKARARADAEQALNQARASVDSTAAMIKATPVSKKNRAKADQMKQDLAAMQQMLTEADTDFSAEDFDGSMAKSQDIQSRWQAMKGQ